MTPDGFRKLALSLPGVIESAHMGHPDFRANGRIFATLGAPDATMGMVSLTPDEQTILVEGAPHIFRPVKGGWGLKGATNVILAKADKAAVLSGLTLAWKGVMAKKPARPRKSS